MDYRNDDTIKENGVIMASMATAANAQNQTLKVLAEKTQKDSRSMRIITFIAMAYLPATLIAVRKSVVRINETLDSMSQQTLFSTSILQISSTGDSSSPTMLRVHKEIWIYVFATLVLTGITLVVTLWWDRKARRHDRKEACLV